MSIHLVDTDLLDVITSSVADLDVHVAFIDATLSTGLVINMDKQQTAIVTATTTTIAAAPTGATKIRNITSLFIRNKHASLSNDVTIRVNGTLDVELIKVTLLAGQTLQYSEALGFYVLPSSRLDRWLRVSGVDYVNATTSFTDITGLTCLVLNGKIYNFEAHLFHVMNATTTGPRFGINGPTLTAIQVLQTIRSVTLTSADATTVESQSGAPATAVDTSAGGATGTGNVSVTDALLTGVFTAGADGTFAMRGQSEVAVAAGLTVKIGSWCHVWEATG